MSQAGESLSAHSMFAGQVEDLMDRAWPAIDRHDTGEWVLRAASGVTQRANSVWLREPSRDPEAALREALDWYRGRKLPLIFQVFDRDRNAEMHALLDAGRFTRQSETLIMGRLASVSDIAAAQAELVEYSDSPSVEWLQLWWSIEGKGGFPELAIARDILTGCPSVYALARDGEGAPAAVGRLALVDGWGGLYCMATRHDARRRGHAGRVLRGLLAEGGRRGLSGYWLLVTAANVGAQALYADVGFREGGRYFYRQAPLRRAPGGC